MKKINERKCISCFNKFDKKDLIKITKNYLTNEIEINPDSHVFGRSAYVCASKECVENLLKKDKLSKFLKKNLTENDKEKIKTILESIIVLKL